MAKKKKVSIPRVSEEKAEQINARARAYTALRVAADNYGKDDSSAKKSSGGGSSKSSASKSSSTKKSSQKSSKSSSQKSTKSSKDSGQKSSKSSQKSSGTKKAQSLLDLPRQAANQKLRTSKAATPELRYMERNSNEWAGLHNLEQTLKAQPEKYKVELGQIQARKRQLEQANAAYGASQGYTRDAQGVWRMPGVQKQTPTKTASQTLLEGMLTPASRAAANRAATGDSGQPVYLADTMPGASAQALIGEIEGTKDQARRQAAQQAARENDRTVRLVDRIEDTIRSVVGRAASAVPALLETSTQQARNVQTDRQNQDLQQLQAEADNLRAYLTTIPMETGGAEYQARYRRYLSLLDQIEQMDTDTPVDPGLYGQRTARQAARAAEQATRGLSGPARVIGDAVVGAANTAATLAASGGNPWAAGAILGLEAAAGKTTALNARGASPGDALGRGLVTGGIELLTEKIPAEQLLDLVRVGGRGILQSALRQAGVEATEEGVSYLANLVADAAAQDPEAEISLSELAENMAAGAISGLLLGGAGAGVGNLANRYRTTQGDTAMQQAGPRTTRQNTQASLQSALQNLRTAPQTVAQTVLTAQNVQAAPQVGAQNAQTLPPAYQAEVDDPDSAVQSVQLRQSEGTGSAGTPEQQLAQYRAQVDGVFTGALPSEQILHIGDTPQILQRLGAADLPLTMTQRTARKIAYPEGYGGGKHNLGIPALKKLPEQLQDPLAVLRSKSEPDSFVVLTEWDDTFGNPVVAAIHLNKSGVIEDVNALASAYGKRNLAALLGENNENVLYTKENKSIDQLLSIRLQLPEAKADDTLVAYSIAQHKKENKSTDQILDSRLQLPELLSDDTLVTSSIAQQAAQSNPNPQAETAAPVRPDSSVGAAPTGFDPYTNLTNQYGAIPAGENPARFAYVPQSTTGQDRVRRFYRTAIEAEATPDTMIQDFEDAVLRGEASYNPRKNKNDLQNAVAYLEHMGTDRALAAWDAKMQSGAKITTEDLIAAQILYKQAAKAGDTQTAMRLLGQIAAEYTQAGQAVQSARLLKQATPDGRLAFINRSVENLQDQLNRKRGSKAPQLEIDEQLAGSLLQATTPEQVDQASEALYRDIARQIPGTWADKANAWRYLAMLGNPRTHIRNVIGNMMFSLPVSVKNKVGAALESALLPQGRRTKTLAPLASRDRRDFAAADAQEMMDVLKGGGKYNPEDIIREYQQPFSQKWPVGRALNAAAQANSNALDAEDSIFLGMHYRRALAGYMQANGLRPEQMKNELGAATPELEKARTYAIKEAQKATFRDVSAVANAISRVEDINAGTRLMLGGFMPFKKTPINILKRGVEYSPAGIIKGIKEAAVDLRQGNKTPAEVIDSFSAGMTGTALMALGALLAKEGWLTGADEDERKMQNLSDAEGIQSYALNLGDFTYTVDWSAPASLPLFMGVELWQAMEDMSGGPDQADGTDKLNAFLTALKNITEPAFNLTMMDGIQGAIKSAAYGEGNQVVAAFGNMVSDYAGQFIPTLAGQVARTVDDTRRSTYAGKEITGIDALDQWLQRQQNKVPVLSQSNVPYMDVFGNTDTEPSAALRAFENFVSPGYISRNKTDAATEGLRELYRQTGDAAALPNKPQAEFAVDGEKIELSQDAYTDYVQSRGQIIQDGLGDMFGSAAYQALSDADKLAAVQALYAYATADAKSQVSAYQMDSGQQQAQASGVSPGLYYAYRQQMDALEQQSEDSRVQVAEQIVGDTSLSGAQKDALLTNLVIPAYGQNRDGVNTALEDYQTEYQDVMTPEDYIRAREAFGDKSLTFDALSRGGGKNEQAYAADMADAGLTIAQYYQVKDYKNSLSGQGQKERVVQWMRAQGWTGAQITAAGSAMGYKMGGLQLP